MTTSNSGVANTGVEVFNRVGGVDRQDQPAQTAGTNLLQVDLRS